MRYLLYIFIGYAFVPSPAAAVVVNDSRSEARQAPQPDLLLVLLGGYGSCKGEPGTQDMFKDLTVLRRRLLAKKGIASRYVASCITSSDVTTRITASSFTKTRLNVSLADYEKIILAELAFTTSKKIAIIGHSFGGWQALKLSLMLQDKAEIVSLTTIDPISMVSCVPITMPFQVVLSMINNNLGQGCQRAPSDFPVAELYQLAGKIGCWNHFYQTEAYGLHSGPLAGTTFSGNLEIFGPGFGLKAHKAIDADYRVWAMIFHSLTKPMAA